MEAFYFVFTCNYVVVNTDADFVMEEQLLLLYGVFESLISLQALSLVGAAVWAFTVYYPTMDKNALLLAVILSSYCVLWKVCASKIYIFSLQDGKARIKSASIKSS